MYNDNIFNHMIQNYHTLTKSEAKIADYVLKHKQDIHRIVISELAVACGVGEATVTRFCRTLGCRGFNDFKLKIAQSIAATETSSTDEDPDLYGEVQPDDSIQQKCQKLCAIGTQALMQTLSLMDEKCIDKAVDWLCRADNVYCFGQGNSSIVAMEAWGRFISVTPKFHWIADAHMQANIASILHKNDVVLYFSFSGATHSLSDVGQLVRSTDAKLILVSRFPNSPGAAYADLMLICGANESPQQQGSIAAKIGQLFIIDVLFNEFCSRDLDLAIKNRDRTLGATAPLML